MINDFFDLLVQKISRPNKSEANSLLDYLSSLGFSIIRERNYLDTLDNQKEIDLFLKSLREDYNNVIVYSTYLIELNNVPSYYMPQEKLKLYFTISKKFLDSVDLTDYKNSKGKSFTDDGFKIIYNTIKSEILLNFKSDLLDIVNEDPQKIKLITPYIEKELKELFSSTYVSNLTALNKLQELIKTRDLLDLEVLVNLYMCNSPEEIKPGLKTALERCNKKYLEELNNIESEIERDIKIKNNQEELAHIAYIIRCLLREKQEKISSIVLSALLLAGSCYIVPKIATHYSREYMVNESIYTIDEEQNSKLVSETSHYAKMRADSKVTLMVYDGVINPDGTRNYKEYNVTKMYEDINSLIREELKTRDIIDLGEYKEVKVLTRNVEDTRIDENTKITLAIMGYLLAFLLPGGKLIYNTSQYFSYNEGIKYQIRRQETSISLIERTVDEFLEKLSKTKELEDKFYEILENLDLPVDKENYMKLIENLNERRENISSKLMAQKELARIYRKSELK